MQAGAVRIGIFIAVAIATAVLVASFIPPFLVKNNPAADGLQWVVAFFVVSLYVLLVLPAFVLALVGKRITLIISVVLLVLAYGSALVIFWD